MSKCNAKSIPQHLNDAGRKAFGIGSVEIGRPAASDDLPFDKGCLQVGTVTDTEVGSPLLHTQPQPLAMPVRANVSPTQQ